MGGWDHAGGKTEDGERFILGGGQIQTFPLTVFPKALVEEGADEWSARCPEKEPGREPCGRREVAADIFCKLLSVVSLM